MSEQQDRGGLAQSMMEVPCDHCGHKYDVHFYRPDSKHAGCNKCVGRGLTCPGFHAGTVNVDLSPICANCNHTMGAHAFDYKGSGEDWCNVLECLCKKFKPGPELEKELDEELGVKEETVEETIIETTITRTTTITFDVPIPIQELIDEVNRIATAHGPGAEITKTMVYTDGLMTVERFELTIE